MRSHENNPLDALARGLATGMSRREALKTGGTALIGALALSPVDALAAVTGRCPHHRVRCDGRCCPHGEICLPPKHHGKHRGKRRCGCRAHHTRCAGKCVDTHSDPQNCGACGHVCGSGEVCSSGQCAGECATGQTVCAGACVDLSSDPSHCGSCSTACPSGAICVSGSCACPSGQTVCGGACVDLQTDVNNCGSCGTRCSTCFSTPSCVSGTCHNTCAPDWVNCSGNPLDGCNCLGTTCNGTCCATGPCNPGPC